MCKRVQCPNDGKPTWWGCGGHIELALIGVPAKDRCECPHEPIPGRPGMFEVPKKENKEDKSAAAQLDNECFKRSKPQD